MSIFAGKKIPLPTDEKNVLSLSYQEELVRSANAFLGLKVSGGKLLISDNNAELVVDGSSASSATTSSDLPWQITLQDTPDGRTVQVGAGFAIPVMKPGLTYSPEVIFVSSGHETNVTVPASTTYVFWVRCLDGVAEIQYGEWPADIPYDWLEYPATQPIDEVHPRWNTYGYFIIGTVNTSASPATITQYLTHNPQLEIVGSEEVIFKGSWVSGNAYRLNSIVFDGGNSYIRTDLALGDDGGDPSGGNDWTPL